MTRKELTELRRRRQHVDFLLDWHHRNVELARAAKLDEAPRRVVKMFEDNATRYLSNAISYASK